MYSQIKTPEEIQPENELKYQDMLVLKNDIENSYRQIRLNINKYCDLVYILSFLGDYKDVNKITQDTLTQLKIIRSRMPEEIVRSKPELQQKIDKLIEITEKSINDINTAKMKNVNIDVPEIKWGRKRDYLSVIFVLLWVWFIYHILLVGSPIKVSAWESNELQQQILQINSQQEKILRA